MKITLENVTKKFQDKYALKDVSFSVESGELITIIGSSGSGKSVLIRCISGLMQPTSGTITCDGKEVKGTDNPILKVSGMVFQGGALFDSMSVWRNVAFSHLIHGIGTKKEARETALKTLEEVNLDSQIADWSISELSGGMQQRVSIARTIFQKPKIMFFDEPTASLDVITASQINHLIMKTVGEHKATALVVNHNPKGIRLMHKRILVLEQGKLVYDGPYSSMHENKNQFIQDFIKAT